MHATRAASLLMAERRLPDPIEEGILAEEYSS